MALPSSRKSTVCRSPGRRVYASVATLPSVYNGLGISILSTPKGVMSDADARAQNVGGEVLCTVF
jgi:small subunit ribosomal protein S8